MSSHFGFGKVFVHITKKVTKEKIEINWTLSKF
jgi:hypothetical protein